MYYTTTTEDFKYFIEYFKNKKFKKWIEENPEEYIDFEFVDIKKPPKVEGYESFVKFKIHSPFTSGYGDFIYSDLIIYNTSSPFALTISNITDTPIEFDDSE